MTHHHLRFHSSYSFKCYAYYDEYRCTAHSDLYAAYRAEDYGEDSADEGDLSEYPLEVVAGRFTGSYTGDTAV